MFELCQTFSGLGCDKILDLLVTQCHGELQQYVDNMEHMIHHTVAAAIQLDINTLSKRVDPATLTGPARNIAQALLRDNADIDPSWMHDPLAWTLLAKVPWGGCCWGCSLAACLFLCLGLLARLPSLSFGFPSLVVRCRWVCCWLW